MSSNIVLSSLKVSRKHLVSYPPLKSCSCFRREVGRVEIQLPVLQPTSPVHSLLPPDPTAVPRGLPSSSLPRTSCWAPQLAPPPGSSGSPSPAMSPRLCLLLPTVSFIYFHTFTLGNWFWNKSSMNWDESWLTWSPCPCHDVLLCRLKRNVKLHFELWIVKSCKWRQRSFCQALLWWTAPLEQLNMWHFWSQ